MEPEPAPVDVPEREFARGYADASAGRRRKEKSEEYERGYEAGWADHKAYEQSEIEKFRSQLDALDTRS